jgi:alanyl-tRNA synthetase
MQFFGEKYGDWVRVVQVGGKPTTLDGYSMELCGGTHVKATGEIGLFRITSEAAIAAGVRRIEAVAGMEAYQRGKQDLHLIRSLSEKLNAPAGELEKKVESVLARERELEKQFRALQQKEAAETARRLLEQSRESGGIAAIVANLGAADGDTLQGVIEALKSRFKGVVVLGGGSNGTAALVAAVSPELTRQFQAGKIIQALAPIIGGKGGGRPEYARGGGKDPSRLEEALTKARELLGLA